MSRSPITKAAFHAALALLPHSAEWKLALHLVDAAFEKVDEAERDRAIGDVAGYSATLPGVTPEAQKLFLTALTEGLTVPQWSLLDQIQVQGGERWLDDSCEEELLELHRRKLIRCVDPNVYRFTDLCRLVMRLRTGSST